MNQIEAMRNALVHMFPRAEIALLKPKRADGFWSMDVRTPENYHLAIDWRAESGFGLTSDAEHGYGEPADEHYAEFFPALTRTAALIQTAVATIPPCAVRIKELRLQRELSQEEVAQRMGVNQAAVSKLEARDDTHVATLQNYIHALGGRLVLRAAFDEGEKEIELVGAG